MHSQLEKRKSHRQMYKNKRLLSSPQDCKGFLSDSKNLKLEFIGQGMEGILHGYVGIFTIFLFKNLPQTFCGIYEGKYHPHCMKS